ncbi:hypothetical protein AGDE_14673 [Angomonas deanei]|uniref:Uncharacterized protein n=1 Tax=Angomonas deanei TaxID=59799 RepID=A0A7G2CD38_9TRYP|nr:hypothetical protein AGDE_14673 [Angomonas deanei]CAD2217740.1 hypothetical protein, conserved [Angomonas deanei]|eukprot:EPY20437.1 hypothetical protein AGDE_14673 [Angomonas deanei]
MSGRDTAKPGDLPPVPSKSSRSSSFNNKVPGSPSAGSELSEQELLAKPKEFLVQRVQALERQLKIRNSDCSRLLQERHELLPLKEKCNSQREMILALKEQLEIAKVEKASALEAVERYRKEERNAIHQERIGQAEAAMGGRATPKIRVKSISDSPPPSKSGNSSVSPLPPGGTVVQTSLGPQVIYNSSDISTVGFSKQSKPVDFLGGDMRFTQGKAGTGAHAGGSGDEVKDLMERAKDEANTELKYAEYEEDEDRKLHARLEALKKR